jgi:hypothetical protein
MMLLLYYFISTATCRIRVQCHFDELKINQIYMTPALNCLVPYEIQLYLCKLFYYACICIISSVKYKCNLQGLYSTVLQKFGSVVTTNCIASISKVFKVHADDSVINTDKSKH